MITGTRTLTSSELADVTASLTGSCFNDDSSELEERLRAAFQDRVYFLVEVKHLRIKAADPLGVPKAVSVEAEANAGPRYRLASLDFIWNRAFGVGQLRARFPIRIGDTFSRARITTGLEKLRVAYPSVGYVDTYFIPTTKLSGNATIDLAVAVEEGKQYHTCKVEIFGPKDIADQMQTHWEPSEGSVYGQTYLRKFLDENHALLPGGFTQSGNVVVAL